VDDRPSLRGILTMTSVYIELLKLVDKLDREIEAVLSKSCGFYERRHLNDAREALGSVKSCLEDAQEPGSDSGRR
jgi:hypothetical protein